MQIIHFNRSLWLQFLLWIVIKLVQCSWKKVRPVLVLRKSLNNKKNQKHVAMKTCPVCLLIIKEESLFWTLFWYLVEWMWLLLSCKTILDELFVRDYDTLETNHHDKTPSLYFISYQSHHETNRQFQKSSWKWKQLRKLMDPIEHSHS